MRIFFSTINITLLATFLFFGHATPASALSLSLGGGGGNTQVTIVGDVSDTAINTFKNTVTTALGINDISGNITELITKEKVLDPIQWAMSKQLQQQLTGNMLKWIGGQLDGQNGVPQFVQDYASHYLDISAQIGGEYVFGDEISGLCSDEEDFLVKEQVYKYLVKVQSEGGGEMFSCTDDTADDSQDLLTTMALGIGTCNTPICAQYAAKTELAQRQLNAVENESKILENTRGMLAQKVCEGVQTAAGDTRTNCKIVSPLHISADAASFQLVDLPGLQLLNMDEFNESVSNLMANLTNQALTSITGVLGLSGHSSYSNNVFGSSGSLSYVDALIQDNVSNYQSLNANPIGGALNAVKDYTSIRLTLLQTIDQLDAQNEANKDKYPGCYDLELSYDLNLVNSNCFSNDNLASLRTDLNNEVAVSSSTLSILNLFNNQFNSTTDSGVKVAILNSFTDFKNQNPALIHTNLDNQTYVTSCVDLDINEMFELFEYQMSVEESKCN